MSCQELLRTKGQVPSTPAAKIIKEHGASDPPTSYRERDSLSFPFFIDCIIIVKPFWSYVRSYTLNGLSTIRKINAY
jgi:hypothetical protein